jgi:nucleotide-binding universal stress UspA family protein
MRKLTALVDGSTYAHSVCDHAAWIAQRADVSVELLHVLGRREMSGSTSDLSGNIKLGARSALLAELSALDEQRAKLAQKRGWAILEDAKAILEKAGIEDISTRLRIGDLVETVAESEADASMLLVGKRGEAADFAKGHLGSNVERLARASHRPLFVASRAFRPIERVMVAHDGGDSIAKAIDHMATNSLLDGLNIHLLSVGVETKSASERLERDAARLAEAGHHPTTEIVSGQPETVFADRVEGGQVDLLVMGAYGHSRIRNLVIGSTTTTMLQSCKVPVLLFR